MPVDGISYLQTEFDAAILGPIDGRGAALQNAYNRIELYMIERRASARRQDVVQAILDLEFEDFDWTAKVGVLTNLTLGGVGTTGFVFASALLYLARHPGARALLCAEPQRLAAAVEEFLRFYAPSPHDGRRILKAIEVDGVAMSPGDYVILSFGAASRDPNIFESPHEIRLDRPLPNRHLAFGRGIHRCIGSHLARLEIRIGIETFLAEVAEFSVSDAFEPSYQISNTRVMESLPLHLGW